MKKHYKVIIVGGGTAGITVGARLLRKRKALHGDVAIIDPADHHAYQPLWTLAGAGVVEKERTRRDMGSVIPDGADWIKKSAAFFDPENHRLTTTDHHTFTYDYLVAAPGIHVHWEHVKGLPETLGKNSVCSIYSYEHVDDTWNTIRNFKGGNAIFTHPNTPIKCGGAPQKIMYLAEEAFGRAGIRDRTNVIFESANPAIFDVPKYRAALEKVLERKSIQACFRRHLVKVDGERKKAVFEDLETGSMITRPFEMLHVCPPMAAPDFIQHSLLADEAGWIDVHPRTLQHNRFANVFGLGDASNLPTSKTGAAIRKQAPVVVENLMALMDGRPLRAQYDGYTSCPVVTGYNKVVLAEFDYDKRPRETMPFNQAVERRSMYFLKKNLLPIMYWKGMLKGKM